MHGPSMSIAGLSDIGRVRKNNEDSFTVSDLDAGERLEAGTSPWRVAVGPRGVLLALSDGMGGHAAGEVASALSSIRCGRLFSWRETSSPSRNFYRPPRRERTPR